MPKLPGSPIPLFKLKFQESGKIKDIKEMIVRVKGLPSCLYGQIVHLGGESRGIIMGYDERDVLVLVLGDAGKLRMGGDVSGVSEPFRIPVGERFLGRMVTALGDPCDQAGEIEPSEFQPIFQDSPSITDRSPVDQFMPTGTKTIDIICPIAKGQRQLILGDRLTGKTVIALDAILNQKGRNCICVYCCIGKSVSALEKAMKTLQDSRALEYTIVVVATDSSPTGEQYLVPFSAVAMGDYFAMKGKDVLVVFDDLTKHAWAYRQLSLLLERPPGREAYPGDIFYVQTQLMERAGRFNKAHGGASMTFIGIAETLQGDLTGYIPSNLASMCDGQICMSTTSFAEGQRPAIDFTLSLSIIGGRVHPPILKALSRNIRAEFARYNELVRLSKLQSGLSAEARRVMDKGQAILAVLQQGPYRPVTLAEQALLLCALQKGRVSTLSDADKQQFRERIYTFACETDRGLVDAIETKQDLTPEIEQAMTAVLDAYFAGAANKPKEP